jgi:hypothetical protein
MKSLQAYIGNKFQGFASRVADKLEKSFNDSDKLMILEVIESY